MGSRPVSSAPHTSRPTAILAVLLLAVFAYSMLETMLVPALPRIQQEVGASTSSVAWVFTGLLLSGAVATPIVGRLADLYDKKRVLLVVLALVSVGIVLAALATSIVVLAAGQALQGVGLGLVPLSVGIVRDTLPADRARTANGLLIGVVTLSAALGLVAAGPIADHLSYHWLFWFALIVLAACAVAAVRFVPTDPPTATGATERIDWAGAGVLAAGLTSLLVAVTKAAEWGWSSTRVSLLFAAAGVLLAGFAAIELRVRAPMVDLRLLARPTVLATCVVAFIVGFGTFAAFVIVPLMVRMPTATGYGFGAKVTETGYYVLPLGATAAVCAPLAGALGRRIGSRTLMMVGTCAIAGGLLLLAAAHDNARQVYTATAVAGVGLGLALTEAMNIVMVAVPAERVAGVSGITFVARSIGGTLGAQIGATVLASDVSAKTHLPTGQAFTDAFTVAGGVSVLALVVCFVYPRRHAVARQRGSAAPEIAG